MCIYFICILLINNCWQLNRGCSLSLLFLFTESGSTEPWVFPLSRYFIKMSGKLSTLRQHSLLVRLSKNWHQQVHQRKAETQGKGHCCYFNKINIKAFFVCFLSLFSPKVLVKMTTHCWSHTVCHDGLEENSWKSQRFSHTVFFFFFFDTLSKLDQGLLQNQYRVTVNKKTIFYHSLQQSFWDQSRKNSIHLKWYRMYSPWSRGSQTFSSNTDFS